MNDKMIINKQLAKSLLLQIYEKHNQLMRSENIFTQTHYLKKKNFHDSTVVSLHLTWRQFCAD